MIVHEFVKGMKDHFGISNGNRFLDQLIVQASKKVSLDIIKFDEWLHEQEGLEDYESEDKSCADVVRERYGEAAEAFIGRAIGSDAPPGSTESRA